VRRDWRTYVAAASRVCIALALLLLAFVAYQLWGTGIQEARAQRLLRHQFDEVLSTTVPPVPVESTTASPATTAESVVRPLTGTLPVPSQREPSPTLPTFPGAPRTHPEIKDGDPVARLQIPAINLDKVVVSGIDPGDLRRGPGHYLTTPLPGEVGNAGIAGHRTTAGAPFGDLDKLQVGDEIIATTKTGRFRYLVVRTKIVSPSDTSVLAPTTDVRLTLTTCNPKFSTAERLIVTAVLDPQSANHPLATTAPVAAATTPVRPTTPSPTVPAAATVPVTTIPAAPSTAAEAPASEPLPTTTLATTVPTTAAAPVVSDLASDGVAGGWFSDSGAWPGVLMWGLVLTGLAFAAWGVSRAAGRDWVGALVGIGPFLIVLYFWFENVDRLLPPNL
jgi:sortase A